MPHNADIPLPDVLYLAVTLHASALYFRQFFGFVIRPVRKALMRIIMRVIDRSYCLGCVRA